MKHTLLKTVMLQGKIVGRTVVGEDSPYGKYNIELENGQILKDIPEAHIKEFLNVPSQSEVDFRHANANLHPYYGATSSGHSAFEPTPLDLFLRWNKR
jgi:hypothetical protein